MSIHISSEDRVWYNGNMLDSVLYVFVGCFVVRGCAWRCCHEEVYVMTFAIVMFGVV